jgi:CRP-like cAMP-binding protein
VDVLPLIRTTIAQTRLFSGWPAEILDRIAQGSELHTYRSGDFVLRRSVRSDHMIVLESGTLVSQRTLKNGKLIVFDFLMPGQSTSHIAVLDGQAPAFDIVARTSTAQCVLIPRLTLLEAIGNDPVRLMDIIQFLCRRTRLDYEAIHSRTVDSLRCQIAKQLIYWVRGTNAADISRVPFAVSQDDLAAILGASRQTINREIVALAREGIVSQSYRNIEIADIDRLVAIIEEEDPAGPEISDALFNRPKNLFRATD